MPQLQPPFQIDATPGSAAYLIRVRGDLDLAESPALELALTKAEESETDRILLDIEALTFVDASGLSLLHRAGERSTINGNRLWITRGTGQVARMFRLTALDASLPFAKHTLSGFSEAG